MNAMTTHCTRASKAPSPPSRVENPPVASVVSAWHTASNAGTSSSSRMPTSAAVSTTPHDHRVPRGLADLRLGLLRGGAGNLGGEDIHPPLPPAEHPDEDDHDAQPAEPLRQRPPEEERTGQRFDLGEDRRAGRREPRGGLEEAVHPEFRAEDGEVGKRPEHDGDAPTRARRTDRCGRRPWARRRARCPRGGAAG